MTTKCIAHRGLSGLYPENTMISFQKALEHNPDCIELDIHLTKDNRIVICHDETLDRTTNGIHSYGLKINAWGIGSAIDDPQVIRRLMSYGVDGIMTNRADVMMEIKKNG